MLRQHHTQEAVGTLCLIYDSERCGGCRYTGLKSHEAVFPTPPRVTVYSGVHNTSARTRRPLVQLLTVSYKKYSAWRTVMKIHGMSAARKHRHVSGKAFLVGRTRMSLEIPALQDDRIDWVHSARIHVRRDVVE